MQRSKTAKAAKVARDGREIGVHLGFGKDRIDPE
jgi:hypothetical protein